MTTTTPAPTTYTPGAAQLPASAAGLLGILSAVATSGTAYPVARTYDGHAWEGVMPAPLDLGGCTSGAVPCSTTLPALADVSSYRLNWRAPTAAA